MLESLALLQINQNRNSFLKGNKILKIIIIAHYIISCTYLKFCINCANASVLPARGTITLMIDLEISTVSLFTFMRGPKGRNKVTCLYSMPSIFL